MGFRKRLSEWSAESDAFERVRDADSDGPVLRRRSPAGWLVLGLRVLAVVVVVFGTWGGVVIGRSLDGWSRPVGLAVPGWMVILGAWAASAVLVACAAVVRRLERWGR